MTIEIAPDAVLPIAMILGLLIGSFLNVVIHRLPLGISVVFPPSHCPNCEMQIKPWDNIPVLSYVFLRGRCRGCANPISMRYPAVELVTGLLFLAIAARFGQTWWTPLHCLFAAALIAAAMIDFDHQIIPDGISMGGLAIAVLLIPSANAYYGMPWMDGLTRSAIGAAVGAGVLWSVAFLHARICVAMGREFDHWPGEGESIPRPSEADYWLWFPGLGLGDVKLLGMIGAVVGVVGVLDTILASAVIGLVLGGAQALARGALGEPFGFAPSIALGAIASLFLPPLWLLNFF